MEAGPWPLRPRRRSARAACRTSPRRPTLERTSRSGSLPSTSDDERFVAASNARPSHRQADPIPTSSGLRHRPRRGPPLHRHGYVEGRSGAGIHRAAGLRRVKRPGRLACAGLDLPTDADHLRTSSRQFDGVGGLVGGRGGEARPAPGIALQVEQTRIPQVGSVVGTAYLTRAGARRKATPATGVTRSASSSTSSSPAACRMGIEPGRAGGRQQNERPLPPSTYNDAVRSFRRRGPACARGRSAGATPTPTS